MNSYNHDYYCTDKKMFVSRGYCERCFDCGFNNGSQSWADCISSNLTNISINEINNYKTELRMQYLSG